jgi:hypothetical protein
MPWLAGRGCVPAVVGLASTNEPTGAVDVESIIKVTGFIWRLKHGHEEYPVQRQACGSGDDQSKEQSGALSLNPINGSAMAWHSRDSRITGDELAISGGDRIEGDP